MELSGVDIELIGAPQEPHGPHDGLEKSTNPRARVSTRNTPPTNLNFLAFQQAVAC